MGSGNNRPTAADSLVLRIEGQLEDRLLAALAARGASADNLAAARVRRFAVRERPAGGAPRDQVGVVADDLERLVRQALRDIFENAERYQHLWAAAALILGTLNMGGTLVHWRRDAPAASSASHEPARARFRVGRGSAWPIDHPASS